MIIIKAEIVVKIAQLTGCDYSSSNARHCESFNLTFKYMNSNILYMYKCSLLSYQIFCAAYCISYCHVLNVLQDLMHGSRRRYKWTKVKMDMPYIFIMSCHLYLHFTPGLELEQ